jgi:glycosyltransferase involved in cell wall biosynthesis
MRILHVVHQFLPEHVGGTESHVRGLALAQQAAGHTVAVFARRFGPGNAVLREEVDGLPVIRAASGPYSAAGRFLATFRSPYLAAAIRSEWAAFQPDVVHVHHLMGLPTAGLTGIASRAPIIVTLHDYWWVCANAQAYTSFDLAVCEGPRAWLNCGRCGLARFGHPGWRLAVPAAALTFGARARALAGVARRVSRWIAPTDFVRDWHIARGWPGDRVVTVRHGIEAPPAGVVASARSRDPQRGARHFGYLGGLAWQKGVHLLLDAFDDLPDDVRLTIAGDESVFPEYCADLHRRARHRGVAFVGLLDQRAVWRTLAAIDALVVPSVWYETSSLIAQEALAVGTPVVASDHGALVERVTPEVNGLRFTPGSVEDLRAACRRLMDEPGLLGRLSGRPDPVRSVADAAREIEDVYRAAAAQTARPGAR